MPEPTRGGRTTRGTLVFDTFVALGVSGGARPNVWTSPPEWDIAIRNAVNAGLTAEITGVGAACSATTGPAITAECAVAATDLPTAYANLGTVVAHVERTRYTASAVFGENNANLAARYARGWMRIKITNTDAVNTAFVRIRLWVSLETSDGEYIDASVRGALATDAVSPFLWSDEMILLDGTAAAGASHWTMSAGETLPMRDKSFAAYTVDYTVVGSGTAEVDFERTVMPTEIDAAWQPMNPAPVAMAAGTGYITRSFAADGTTTLAPRGYQRVHFRNTHAANWVAIRARTWAHLSGT